MAPKSDRQEQAKGARSAKGKKQKKKTIRTRLPLPEKGPQVHRDRKKHAKKYACRKSKTGKLQEGEGEREG